MLMDQQEMAKRIVRLEKEVKRLKQFHKDTIPARMSEQALQDWHSESDEKAYAHLQ